MTENFKFQKAQDNLEEFALIEKQLSDPEIISKQDEYKKLGRKYAALKQVVLVYKEYLSAVDNLEVAKELAEIEPEYKDQIATTEIEIAGLEDKLRELLIPRDPDDVLDVIMEIKAGAGGEESALFAGDLMRMYQKFADIKGWKMEVLDSAESDLGGYKDLSLRIFNPKNLESPDDGVWANLKYEAGVHRVQRVPVTESQGRVHTSATAVLVFPEYEVEEEEIDIPEKDLRIDVFRAGGPGGQCVNTTDSAVRITHLPTGTTVSMQNEKSQIQNRAAAMKILKSRLLALKHEEEAAKEADMRHSQVRTADRSERIRTYNFPENRIADHRTGYKSSNLDRAMNGDLTEIIQSAIDKDKQSKLDN
ncbi:MAG: peptide chain release factor 1 [Bifidobacteriaceae bacterium]|jgi:peptide chain release factor 1|nr:peptide chain release factor 1 [Bifidobacteriaceae bacterium]